MQNTIINPDELQIEIKEPIFIKPPQLAFTIPLEFTKDLKLYELEYIISIIQTYFPSIDYSIFKTQKDILNHFHLCESLCLSFISKTNQKSHLYKKIIYRTLTDIFNSPSNLFKKPIKAIIDSINPSSFKHKDKYYLELYRQCRTNAIPKFLFQKVKKKMKSMVYYNKYEQFLHSFYLRDEIKIATNSFIALSNGQSKPFESFNTNIQLLFAIAILANHSNLNRSHYALLRLKNRFNDYKAKFINGHYRDDRLALMTFDNIYLTYIDINEKEAKELLKVCIEVILKQADKNNKLVDIFTSFFFIFRGGDAREVVFIKNIILEFKSYISTPPFDFQTLFSYIESFDVIMNHVNMLENFSFDYKAIHNYLYYSPLLNQEYYSVITKLEKVEKLKSDSIMNNIINMFFFYYSPFESIQLTPLSNITHSNTITILIDGYLQENKEISHYIEDVVYSETRFEEFYCFKWPADNIIKAIAKILIKSMTPGERSLIKNFRDTKEKAKLSGKILGLMLYSKQLFPWQTFNLVGYSLGSHVVKHCIKQINKLNEMNAHINTGPEDRETIIANVLFTGGATKFGNGIKWSNIFDRCVSGRVINCYTHEDNILNYCYRAATGNNPIGLQPLNNSRVENYDLSEMHIGHLDYWSNFKEIINKVNLF